MSLIAFAALSTMEGVLVLGALTLTASLLIIARKEAASLLRARRERRRDAALRADVDQIPDGEIAALYVQPDDRKEAPDVR